MRGGTPPRKRKRTPSPSPDRNRDRDDTRTKKRARSYSDSSDDRTPPRRTTSTRDDTRGRAPSFRSRTPPRTRQEQYRSTRLTPPRRSPSPPRIQPRWPTVGRHEQDGPEQRLAVRQSRDLPALFQLWRDLTAREPDRGDLIRTVERNVIRTQLDFMMGGTNATRANIQIDGRPMRITDTRVPDPHREWDVKATSGTPRQNAVWNTSRRDTEVETIRDIRAWARTLSRQDLLDAREILLQVVGTSGPCEACKDRLRFMVRDIEEDWIKDTGLRRDQLPRLEVWSYYGNPPETPYTRGRFTNVLNGWPGDRTPGDLTFTNQAGRIQVVREHRLDI